MNVRAWWDNAKETDQAAVLVRLLLDRELASIPWAFLPEEVKELLIGRVRIDAAQLNASWRRTPCASGED